MRRFAKYEGLGNDFVVIEGEIDSVDASDAVRLCDRRRGIGADGVLVVSQHPELDARMRVINADGSIPEMCGNGIRCVALHIAIDRDVDDTTLVIATDAGPRTCEVKRSGDRASVRVDMGRVRFEGDREIEVGARSMHRITVQYFDPADGDDFETAYRERHVPLVQAVPGLERFTISLPHADGAPYLVAELWFADGDALTTARTSAEMAAVRADSATYDVAQRVIFGGSVEDVGERVKLAIGNAGNPHAIIFGELSDARIDSLGPRIATHEAFPAGTNVEFATIRDGGIDLVVWERGVGRTLACGTGACATAVIAVAKGLVRGKHVRVSLPGGDLDIEPAEETTFMTGPARLVFRGEVEP